MRILFSVTYVGVNVKTSTTLPVILQEGNITNTDRQQSRYAFLGFAFLCFVVLFFGGDVHP